MSMEVNKEQREEKEIKLTDKQFEIVAGILVAKNQLEQEYKKVLQRETEVILTICESAGVEAGEGIRVENKSLFVPVQDKKEKKKQK